MRNKNNTLLLFLIMTSLLVANLGAYLKHGVMKPLDLYQSESIMAIPFLLLSDEAAREQIRITGEEYPAEEHLPVTTEPVLETVPEPVTEQPEETIVQIETTDGVSDQPTDEATEAPTEPIIIDETWFDDVLFIGDSRLKAMSVYAPLGNAHYFCDAGLSVFNARYHKCYSDEFPLLKLPELLSRFTYRKVYITLGINGLNRSHEDILEEYQKLMELIQEKQPDAEIIIHSVMTVNRNKAKADKDYEPENIFALNEKLAVLAVNNNAFYIDVNEWAADEEGFLSDESSKDGIHLYAKDYELWSQWLMETASSFGIE